MTAPYHSTQRFGMALLVASVLASAANAKPENQHPLPQTLAQITPCDQKGLKLEDIRTPDTACATVFDGIPALCHAPRVGLADSKVFVCDFIMDEEHMK